jgi:hypothetical protein
MASESAQCGYRSDRDAEDGAAISERAWMVIVPLGGLDRGDGRRHVLRSDNYVGYRVPHAVRVAMKEDHQRVFVGPRGFDCGAKFRKISVQPGFTTRLTSCAPNRGTVERARARDQQRRYRHPGYIESLYQNLRWQSPLMIDCGSRARPSGSPVRTAGEVAVAQSCVPGCLESASCALLIWNTAFGDRKGCRFSHGTSRERSRAAAHLPSV